MEKNIILTSPKKLAIYLDIMENRDVAEILNKHKISYNKYLCMKRFLIKKNLIESVGKND